MRVGVQPPWKVTPMKIRRSFSIRKLSTAYGAEDALPVTLFSSRAMAYVITSNTENSLLIPCIAKPEVCKNLVDACLPMDGVQKC
jgi:hypothetical protein